MHTFNVLISACLAPDYKNGIVRVQRGRRAPRHLAQEVRHHKQAMPTVAPLIWSSLQCPKLLVTIFRSLVKFGDYISKFGQIWKIAK